MVKRPLRYFSETAYAAATEPKELMIIPGTVHMDLYDRVDVIPFDELTAFSQDNLKWTMLEDTQIVEVAMAP
jgi:hypothetical protein